MALDKCFAVLRGISQVVLIIVNIIVLVSCLRVARHVHYVSVDCGLLRVTNSIIVHCLLLYELNLLLLFREKWKTVSQVLATVYVLKDFIPQKMIFLKVNLNTEQCVL